MKYEEFQSKNWGNYVDGMENLVLSAAAFDFSELLSVQLL